MPVQEVFVDESEFIFETVMRVRNTEVDVGQYLTISALSAILSEAKSRFFYSKEIKDVNSDYQGLIVTDVTINFPTRIKAREELLVEVGVAAINENKGIIHFKVSRMYDGSFVAKASKTVVNYDYRHNQPVQMSASVLEILKQEPFEI